MLDIILAFLTAFTLTYVAIPSIISIAIKKNLVDVPGGRRSHTQITPSLGGIGIFAGVIFSTILWTPFYVFGDLQYILCSFIIIFLIGAKDDIEEVSAKRKLVGQLLAATILVLKAGVLITSFYGVFGINELPFLLSVAISIFVIIAIINAFNLIDGINGLSGGITTIVCLFLGGWFLAIDRIELSIIAFSTAGAVVAFLKYNITPAKVFMGDTGSLLLGLVCSILVIEFMEVNHRELSPQSVLHIGSAPAVAIGTLILPLFDTLRVFIIRSLKGKSPLSPDRSHIHHLLIDTGLTHMQATYILLAINVAFILFVVYFRNLGNLPLLFIIIGVATAMTFFLNRYVKRKKQLQLSSTN